MFEVTASPNCPACVVSLSQPSLIPMIFGRAHVGLAMLSGTSSTTIWSNQRHLSYKFIALVNGVFDHAGLAYKDWDIRYDPYTNTAKLCRREASNNEKWDLRRIKPATTSNLRAEVAPSQEGITGKTNFNYIYVTKDDCKVNFWTASPIAMENKCVD